MTFNESGASLSGENLIAFLRGHDGAVIGLEKMEAAVFDAVPELRTISKYGVGLDAIDLEAMAARGVRLGWQGGVNRRSVSELALCMMIALLRHVPTAHDEVRQDSWVQRTGLQLTGKTVGVVGCGNVGQDLVRLLQPFGCTILAHDTIAYPEFWNAFHVRLVPLDDLLSQSDIVSLHIPLDRSTALLMSRERLARMRPHAILINVARGGLVDETALKEMLRQGHIAGAGLDGLASDGASAKELVWLPNVLVTPHIGGSTEEAILAMGRAAILGLANAIIPSAHDRRVDAACV